MSMRLWRPSRVTAILAAGFVALGFLLIWFFGNFFYDLFWAFLEKHHVMQADVIAYTLAHVVPFIFSAVLIAALYFIVRYELAKNLSASNTTHATAAIEFSAGGERNVWLYDAICRMFLGRWEKIPIKDGHLDLSANGFQAIHDLIEHVRQLAFDGRFPIWGKTQGYTALWEKSAPAFWKSHQIDYHSFTDGEPTKLCAVPRDTGGQVISLRELMTNRATVDAISAKELLPTNDANSLRILTGDGAPFVEIAVNKYGEHRTISVGVTNVGSKRISNCKFYRTYVQFTDDNQKTMLDGPFSLDPAEIRYISIAMFNETKDLPHADHLIGLSMPPEAAGYGVMAPRLPPDRRHVVSFIAELPDSKDAELHCQLWVDERGKLRLETL